MNGGRVINVILEREGLKAATFAKTIGVTPTQIYDLQSGKTQNITAKVASKILKVYPHYMYSWLLSGDGDIVKYESQKGITPTNSETNVNLLNTPIPMESAAETDENTANVGKLANSFEELLDKYEDMTQQRDYWRNKATELEYKMAKSKVV